MDRDEILRVLRAFEASGLEYVLADDDGVEVGPGLMEAVVDDDEVEMSWREGAGELLNASSVGLIDEVRLDALFSEEYPLSISAPYTCARGAQPRKARTEAPGLP